MDTYGCRVLERGADLADMLDAGYRSALPNVTELNDASV